MAYCTNCPGVRAYGDPEVEVESEDLREDGTFSVTVKVDLPCEECGQPIKTSTFDFEGTLVDNHQHGEEDDPHVDEDITFEGMAVEAEYAESSITGKYNKAGVWKPWKARYHKTLRGAKITISATCATCQEDVTLEAEDTVQASSFDEA